MTERPMAERGWQRLAGKSTMTPNQSDHDSTCDVGRWKQQSPLRYVTLRDTSGRV